MKIQRLNKDIPLPDYATDNASGMDLVAAESCRLEPYGRALVPTGIAIAVPPGYEAQVRPRSGMAIKRGITVLNTPGTIDADYRGEVKVILLNTLGEHQAITRGDRIAQLVIAPVVRPAIVEVESLDDTRRGAGGFGSTGWK